MNSLLGRTVRLFLVDGTASGLITAEIMNWTGHVLVGPRSGLPVFLKRRELERTGIYFLEGSDPKDPDTPQVYIGESDIVSNRLRHHSRDGNKDFWERTCVVTSKDQNITKAHARYLESELISMANSTGSATVVNGTAPPRVALPEADESDMQFFIDQLLLILPVLGFDFLPRHKTAVPTGIDPIEKRKQAVPGPEFQLKSRKHGLAAKAREVDGEFVVRAGSLAAREWSSASDHSYSRRHARLIKSQKLVPGAKGHLQFAEDVVFPSPSAASAVILGRPDNGRLSWKVSGSNVTYGKWQSEQIRKSASEASNPEEDLSAPG